LDSRLTTKHGVVAVVVVLVVDCVISWKATGTSLDDTVDEIFGVRVDVDRVPPIREERVARFGFVCDWRFTTKHGFAVVDVVVGRAIARKAMNESLDDTMIDASGVLEDALCCPAPPGGTAPPVGTAPPGGTTSS